MVWIHYVYLFCIYVFKSRGCLLLTFFEFLLISPAEIVQNGAAKVKTMTTSQPGGCNLSEDPAYMVCKGRVLRTREKPKLRDGLAYRKCPAASLPVSAPKQSAAHVAKPGRSPDGLSQCGSLETVQLVMLISCNKYRRERLQFYRELSELGISFFEQIRTFSLWGE